MFCCLVATKRNDFQIKPAFCTGFFNRYSVQLKYYFLYKQTTVAFYCLLNIQKVLSHLKDEVL